MGDHNDREHLSSRPIEKHTTAAWANKEKLKEVSNVTIPNENEVENAKEWVDTNQK